MEEYVPEPMKFQLIPKAKGSPLLKQVGYELYQKLPGE